MTSRTFSYAAGVAFAAAGAVCWSTGGALVRLTVDADVWQIVFFRSLMVLLCMVAWLVFQFGRHLPARMVSAGFNAIAAGIAVAMAGLTFLAALFQTTVADAIFMTGISPFLAAILGLWILRERIRPVTWIAMTVALAGMAFILYGNRGGGALTGTLLALYSAFCFSCYAVLLRWGQNTEMSVAVIWNALFLMIVSAAVMLLPTGLRETPGLEAFAIGWWNAGVIAIMGAV